MVSSMKSSDLTAETGRMPPRPCLTLNEDCAAAYARYMFEFMTDYRWYSRVGLTWEEYQSHVALERIKYKARMYEIMVLGIY